MTHASVFSGIGGPEVAATMLGWENLFHCEINPFGRQVLDYWYPNSKSYEDITTTDFTEWRGRVDVLTGGFPCQPFSYAGRRRGAEDDRYLWPSMYRAIDEIQPTWVVAENVAGILTMVEQGEVSKVAGTATLFDAFDDLRGRFELRETFTLQRICTDLESHGYAVQPVLVPACAVGAPHRRDRVFIVARRKGEADVLNADTDRNNEGGLRASGTAEGEGSHDDIQPCEQSRRDGQTSWTADVHGILRPSAATIPEDSMHSRQLHRPNEEQGSERNERHTCAGGGERICGETSRTDSPHPDSHRGCEVDEHMESELADGAKPVSNGGQRNVADTCNPGRPMGGITEGCRQHDSNGAAEYSCRRWIEMSNNPPRTTEDERRGSCETKRTSDGYQVGERWANFPSVSPVHRGNDGLPFDVDRLTISFGKWRTEALKAYGNAIVPQVMYEIFRAIEQVENQENRRNETGRF